MSIDQALKPIPAFSEKLFEKYKNPIDDPDIT